MKKRPQRAPVVPVDPALLLAADENIKNSNYKEFHWSAPLTKCEECWSYYLSDGFCERSSDLSPDGICNYFRQRERI